MSYREKVEWLYLIAFVVTYVPYFALAVLDPPAAGELPNLPQLGRFGATAVAQMLILAVGFAVLRLRTPADDRGPADERDREIERRSLRYAYFVLITGMILVGVVMPFTEGGWQIVNAALFAIVVAELVQHGLAVRAYRRGWND